ncbi:probable G-protein coupled receptor No18 [Macrosteles quadrilineatus]|uniref:probable G-protein coupled receptor No18 n=1 Tax=Macrosteles quadrilineatus TaxID=74068 RepID=UPI0023E271AF|nr:probable G-protein coupled receptor No18 [Macrosteles quadrilineatus]XP_054281019.1 probable G-protein coupled receptor No18 [Macrosteles quadrilineatus]
MAFGIAWNLSSVCDVLLIVVFVVATASNSLVLLVFYRKPGLRTLSNRFVINLLVTNLLSCWLLLPLVLVDSMLMPSFHSLCAVSQGVSTGLSAASVMSVLLIAIDQYYAVIDPLHYHSHIDNTRCGFMISVSWFFSCLWAVAGGLFYNSPNIIWTSCDRDRQSAFTPLIPLITEPSISVFSVIYSVLTFVLPFSAICWMYLSIYFAAHENSQRTRRNGSSTGFYTSNAVASTPPVSYAVVPVSGQQSADPEDTSESPRLSVKSVDGADPTVFVKPSMTRSPTRSSLRSTSSFIMNSLRCRISNASMFKYREETRAARISALVIVMGLVCWSPFSLVVLFTSPLVGIHVPHSVAKLSLTLLVIASVVSPLLFAHRNRRIQRDIRKLFGITRRSTAMCPPGDRQRAQSQRPRGLPADYSHTALDLLAEGGDENNSQVKTGSFLSRVWWEGGVQIVTKFDKVSGKSLICVPEVALDVDHSRSSFSSGGSASTQRSTSAASISSYTADEC